MPQHIGYVTLVVREYDEAIAYFTQTLGFDLTEDSPSMDREGREKRWVLIAPPGSTCTKILLAKASSREKQPASAIRQAAASLLFLHTDNFWRDYNAMTGKGVKFVREPKEEEYGTVAVFEDLYGNKWDLLQLKADR